MIEKKAEGTKGYILQGLNKDYFFRIYKEDGTFFDYDIHCEEIEIEILSGWVSLYESDDKNILDWSSKALGKDNDNGTRTSR
jgi:hypothetical protein